MGEGLELTTEHVCLICAGGDAADAIIRDDHYSSGKGLLMSSVVPKERGCVVAYTAILFPDLWACGTGHHGHSCGIFK